MSTEAFKGVVYRKDDVEIGGKTLTKYVIGLIVVTNEDVWQS